MGGLSRGEGNSTPHAKVNESCDPDATNVLVPFETGLDNMLTSNTLDSIFHHEVNANGQYLNKIWRFTRAFREYQGFMPCNAYAVAILLHPENIKTTTKIKGHIPHLAPDEKRGASLYDKNCPLEEANVTLVTEIDARVFVDLLHHLSVMKAEDVLVATK
ncbi:hypothetical protein PsorP6_004953 [Peronosclerospora sorghi]|uniref:Uncharacterized protein n=1 Tax=Peronosclerospora sorghi TaxID=230839 RepID=A0ACC0W6D7_9STRA|nr:hypothetical protein PsorP6_004953 [Peronosclerospora sorghi]